MQYCRAQGIPNPPSLCGQHAFDSYLRHLQPHVICRTEYLKYPRCGGGTFEKTTFVLGLDIVRQESEKRDDREGRGERRWREESGGREEREGNNEIGGSVQRGSNEECRGQEEREGKESSEGKEGSEASLAENKEHNVNTPSSQDDITINTIRDWLGSPALITSTDHSANDRLYVPFNALYTHFARFCRCHGVEPPAKSGSRSFGYWLEHVQPHITRHVACLQYPHAGGQLEKTAFVFGVDLVEGEGDTERETAREGSEEVERALVGGACAGEGAENEREQRAVASGEEKRDGTQKGQETRYSPSLDPSAGE